jgi:hypothetical protein
LELYGSDKNCEALARLVLLLLCIQITGASVERVFSACGIVQTAPRNRIKLPKLVKMVHVKGHISLSRERKSKVHLLAPQKWEEEYEEHEFIYNLVIGTDSKDAYEVMEERACQQPLKDEPGRIACD